MSIAELVQVRGIREVLHFTTGNGALGLLATKALLPRGELGSEQLIEFILQHNCDARKDPAWVNYNSLSITRINSRFFEYSQSRHGSNKQIRWCILAFDPSILGHENVVFCTGNNTWPRSKRKKGITGLEQLFLKGVPGTYDSEVLRLPHLDPNVPTCSEAEVLYPGRLSLAHLRNVYFREQDHADVFLAQAETLAVSLPVGCAVVDAKPFGRIG